MVMLATINKNLIALIFKLKDLNISVRVKRYLNVLLMNKLVVSC